MIYKKDNEFLLVPFTAIIGEETYLVINKSRFESNLLERLRQEVMMDARLNGQKLNPSEINVTLPPITYIDNTLTTEEQDRLDLMNTFNDISLDDAMNYIMNNIEPTAYEYEMYKLKLENDRLNDEVLILMDTSATLYEENLSLTEQNLEIMESIADIYETLLSGGE